MSNTCALHPEREATQDLTEDTKRVFPVCDDCFKRYTEAVPVCKHCFIQVKTLIDSDPKFESKPHARACPRYVKPLDDRKR